MMLLLGSMNGCTECFLGGEIHFAVGKGGITAHRGIKMRKEWGRIFKSADTNSVY